MNSLGVTHFQSVVTNLVAGSSYPLMYGEIGMMATSMRGLKMPEELFRDRFYATCAKGLVCWINEAQAWEHPKNRRYQLTPKGKDLIRAAGIAAGGDYHFYKTFDGNPNSLDKYSKTRIQFKGEKGSHSMEEILRDMKPADREKAIARLGNRRH